MSIYTVWIVTPPNYQHSQAFAEVATSLNEALISLGHISKIVTSSIECRGTTIVLGANLLTHIHLQDWPRDMIIWNLEQIFPGSPWLTQTYLDLLKGKHNGISLVSCGIAFSVWDYSQTNIDELAKLGITAKLCRIGYSSCLTTIYSTTPQDIDVLHVGSITQRRIDIINALAAHNVKIHYLFGVYGKERDEWITRSKIIINVHFYESTRFEIVRCSHLMANRKCVVSETSDGGKLYDEGICFTDYSNIVASCLDLLADDKKRHDLENKGFEIFSKYSQADYLRLLL